MDDGRNGREAGAARHSITAAVAGALAEVPEPVRGTVLAAVTAESRDRALPPLGRLWLGRLQVEGFRGVGRGDLAFEVGPGLTLVTGRSGAGKSSLVEALDLAIAGGRRIRSRRAGAARGEWRNVGAPVPSVRVTLAVEGAGADVALHAAWPDGAAIEEVRCTVDGAPADQLAEAGRRFRPILAVRHERVADGVEQVLGALGIDVLDAALARLRVAREEAGRRAVAGREAARRLAERCAATGDPRAARAADLLLADRWDVDQLAELAHAAPTEESLDARRLRQVAERPVPDVDAAAAAAAELEAALLHAAASAGTDPGAARRRAALLDAAAGNGEGPCPVCGEGELVDGWAEAARSEAAELRREAYRAEAAHRRLDVAVAAGRRLLVAPPDESDTIAHLGAAAVHGRARWAAWAALPADPRELLDRLAGTAAASEDALGLRAAAVAGLGGSAYRWRPVARKLAGWLANAPAWVQASAEHDGLLAAERHLEAALPDLRAVRLGPVLGHVHRLWAALGQRPDLALPLVDGVPGPGVLSQGERHGLALSLFLPRATSVGSPFGFVVIDDPVQAMDAERVDAVARILVEAAETHQVIAFTRDGRLGDALERQGLPARVLELERAMVGG